MRAGDPIRRPGTRGAGAFSAYARVDRTRAPTRGAASRLFRVRAGGPQRADAKAPAPQGFSACARMDHGTRFSMSAGYRLIRVRAGGPCIMQLVQDLTGAYPRARGWTALHDVLPVAPAAFPRARGWTVRPPRVGGAHLGSSACARVDRASARDGRAGRWLFRVRAGGGGRKMDCAAA